MIDADKRSEGHDDVPVGAAVLMASTAPARRTASWRESFTCAYKDPAGTSLDWLYGAGGA
jgi:hypothetical protein